MLIENQIKKKSWCLSFIPKLFIELYQMCLSVYCFLDALLPSNCSMHYTYKLSLLFIVFLNFELKFIETRAAR